MDRSPGNAAREQQLLRQAEIRAKAANDMLAQTNALNEKATRRAHLKAKIIDTSMRSGNPTGSMEQSRLMHRLVNKELADVARTLTPQQRASMPKDIAQSFDKQLPPLNFQDLAVTASVYNMRTNKDATMALDKDTLVQIDANTGKVYYMQDGKRVAELDQQETQAIKQVVAARAEANRRLAAQMHHAWQNTTENSQFPENIRSKAQEQLAMMADPFASPEDMKRSSDEVVALMHEAKAYDSKLDQKTRGEHAWAALAARGGVALSKMDKAQVNTKLEKMTKELVAMGDVNPATMIAKMNMVAGELGVPLEHLARYAHSVPQLSGLFAILAKNPALRNVLGGLANTSAGIDFWRQVQEKGPSAIGNFTLDVMPVSGTYRQIYTTIEDFSKGDYTNGMMNSGLTVLSATFDSITIVGTVVATMATLPAGGVGGLGALAAGTALKTTALQITRQGIKTISMDVTKEMAQKVATNAGKEALAAAKGVYRVSADLTKAVARETLEGLGDTATLGLRQWGQLLHGKVPFDDMVKGFVKSSRVNNGASGAQPTPRQTQAALAPATSRPTDREPAISLTAASREASALPQANNQRAGDAAPMSLEAAPTPPLLTRAPIQLPEGRRAPVLPDAPESVINLGPATQIEKPTNTSIPLLAAAKPKPLFSYGSPVEDIRILDDNVLQYTTDFSYSKEIAALQRERKDTGMTTEEYKQRLDDIKEKETDDIMNASVLERRLWAAFKYAFENGGTSHQALKDTFRESLKKSPLSKDRAEYLAKGLERYFVERDILENYLAGKHFKTEKIEMTATEKGFLINGDLPENKEGVRDLIEDGFGIRLDEPFDIVVGPTSVEIRPKTIKAAYKLLRRSEPYRPEFENIDIETATKVIVETNGYYNGTKKGSFPGHIIVNHCPLQGHDLLKIQRTTEHEDFHAYHFRFDNLQQELGSGIMTELDLKDYSQDLPSELLANMSTYDPATGDSLKVYLRNRVGRGKEYDFVHSRQRDFNRDTPVDDPGLAKIVDHLFNLKSKSTDVLIKKGIDVIDIMHQAGMSTKDIQLTLAHVPLEKWPRVLNAGGKIILRWRNNARRASDVSDKFPKEFFDRVFDHDDFMEGPPLLLQLEGDKYIMSYAAELDAAQRVMRGEEVGADIVKKGWSYGLMVDTEINALKKVATLDQTSREKLRDLFFEPKFMEHFKKHVYIDDTASGKAYDSDALQNALQSDDIEISAHAAARAMRQRYEIPTKAPQTQNLVQFPAAVSEPASRIVADRESLSTEQSPLYKYIEKSEQNSEYYTFMEILTRPSLNEPNVDPKILNSGRSMIDLHYSLPGSLLPGPRPRSFRETILSISDLDGFLAKMNSGRPALYHHFAEKIGLPRPQVQKEIEAFVRFEKQRRVFEWGHSMRRQHFERFWQGRTTRNFIGAPGERKDVKTVAEGKLSELFFTNLLNDYLFSPPQRKPGERAPLPPAMLGSDLCDVKGVDVYAPNPMKPQHYLAIDTTTSAHEYPKKLTLQENYSKDPKKYDYDNFRILMEAAKSDMGPAPVRDIHGNVFESKPGQANIEKRVVYLDSKFWNHFQQGLIRHIENGRYYRPDGELNFRAIDEAFEDSRRFIQKRDPSSKIASFKNLGDYLDALLTRPETLAPGTR